MGSYLQGEVEMDSVLATRLEKCARDSGFDISALDRDMLVFTSSHCPLKIWISISSSNLIYVYLSDDSFFFKLTGLAELVQAPLIEGAKIGFVLSDVSALQVFLKRSFQISRALPSSPLEEFLTAVSTCPENTEVERLVKQRIGQDIFRRSLVDYWEGRCAVSGVSILSLLRASHIKPWAKCESDAERLNVFNGILLSPNYDAAFDCGLISFSDEGCIMFSQKFSIEERTRLNLFHTDRIQGFEKKHADFLRWHREKVLLN
jgi:putative restriction endonuclease